jgi:hypothetical protein
MGGSDDVVGRREDADGAGAGQSGGSIGAEGTSQGPAKADSGGYERRDLPMAQQQGGKRWCASNEQELERCGWIRKHEEGTARGRKAPLRLKARKTPGARSQRTGGPTDKRGAGPKKSEPRRTWKSEWKRRW